MFNLPSFIRSLFVFVVIFSVLFAVTKYSEPIKTNVGSVLGVQMEEKTPPLPENIQKEAGASLDDLKEKALQTDLQDVADTTSRVNKIVNDYQALQKTLEKQVHGFFQDKKEKGKQ